MNDNQRLRIDPETGDVMLSPDLQREIQDGLENAREAMFESASKLVNELAPDHRPDYLATALIEFGLQLGAAGWGEDTIEEMLRKLIDERESLLDAVTNTGAMIAMDRVIDEERKSQQKFEELQSQGWLTLPDAAQQIGISEEKLQERLESFERRAKKLGISTAELFERIKAGEEEWDEE